MAVGVMEFKKGDSNVHYFQYQADSWTSGGALFFAAKTVPDNDSADSAAVIDVAFGDSDIVDSSHEFYDADFVTYECVFAPGDVDVTFTDGSSEKHYLGEFQFVPSGGTPESFPGDNDYYDVVVFADIKRGTT